MKRRVLVIVFFALVQSSTVWSQQDPVLPDAPSAVVAKDKSESSSTISANIDEDSPPPSTRGFRGLVTTFVQDQKQIWTSPARLQVSDGAWLAPLGGIAAGLFATDASYSASLSQNPSTISHYKTLSNAGIAGLAGASAGMYLLSFPTHSDHWRETGFLSGEAVLNSLVVIEAMKYSLGRQRPYQDQGNGDFFRGGTSFPSEHAAAAWAIAGVIAHEYSGFVPKLAAYSIASLVDYSRLRSRQHFPSDVFIGSVLGYLVAQSVYSRRHDPEIIGDNWEPPREFVSSERLRDAAFMGSPYVPLDSWVYPAITRLAGLGYVRSAFLGINAGRAWLSYEPICWPGCGARCRW